MTEGVDFSDSRPGGAAIAAAGKAFVIRYVPYQITRNGVTSWVAKGLTAAEVADYQAHGLDIALVFESSTKRALSGQAAGSADGRTAQSAAARLGFPDTTAIYFAVDFDIGASSLPAVDAYLRGAATILGADRVGVYGGRRVVEHCQAAGSARWLWQTYAWSYGVVVPGIHLYQHLNGQTINGGSVDLDRAMQPDFGAWAAPLSAGGIDLMGFPTVLIQPIVVGTVHIVAGATAVTVSDATQHVLPTAIDRAGIAAQHVGGSKGFLIDLTFGPAAEVHFVGGGASITYPPAPPPAAGFSQADLDAARLAGARHEWDREFTGTAGAKVTPLARP